MDTTHGGYQDDDDLSQPLRCVGCGGMFLWSRGEQEWYQQRSFLPPKRCLRCRDRKKAQRAAQRRG